MKNTFLQRLNIALAPPAQASRGLLDLATRYSLLATRTLPRTSLFRIEEGLRSPHLTLYMSSFPSDKETLRLVRKRLDYALQEFTSIDCWATGISLTDGGYIEVSYSKTHELLNLQSTIVRSVEDLAMPVAHLPAHVNESPDRLESLRQHKYEYVGDSFRPHITLGRLAEGATRPFSVERFDLLSFTPRI